MPRLRSNWLSAAIVAAVVVLSGARLLTLSAHERAADMRAAARVAASNHARLIESELQKLLEVARAEARRASADPRDGVRAAPLLAVAPHRQAFWMTDTAIVLRAGDIDPAVSRAVAGDWALSGTGGHAPAAVFGPVRYGSQWFVTAQAPIRMPTADTSAAMHERVAVYDDLNALLLRAQFGRLVNEGYDYELRRGRASSPEQAVLQASRASLTEAVTAAIYAPGSLGPASSAPYLELGIRPQIGWYPARYFVTGSGLIAVLAWLLAWGTHDLAHSLERARGALATARTRLRTVQARLVTEIEQHEELQKSLEHARYHDPSTGLPNRRYFMDQLDRVLRALRTRRSDRVAVGLIHIDRFTMINDTLGHTAGDELLLQAARRFEKVLGGPAAVLARWGGDQLALLVHSVQSAAHMHTIASEVQSACQEPFALRRHRVRIATRIGFTCVESGLQRTEEVLREADIALSVANQQKGTQAVGYTPGMGGAALSLIGLEADLHIALERNEFTLLFQPIVDLRSGRVVGVEALLRWRHPVQGLLTPDKFLGIAEEAGITVPVTHWIIGRACKLAAAWRQRLPADAEFYVSVNLSAAALSDPGLCRHVARILEATRIPPGYLKFELAESGLVNNVSAAREAFAALRGLGIELMLDDFGTGISSLSYLQAFPFDYVKIDRPFVNRTGSAHANTAITAAILQMAASLGLQSVAEVIETQAAAQALLQMGCPFGQGYFYSEPVQAEAALEQLRSHVYPTALVPTIPATELEANAAGGVIPTLTVVAAAAAASDDSTTQLLPPLRESNGIDADSEATLGWVSA